ncbi:MAG: metallophosphoesterase [Stellaceae bacterium]
MRIAVMSDLHLEFDAARQAAGNGGATDFYRRPPQPKADLLVLAGDIHNGPLVIDWVRRHFTIPTVIVLGNHEPYGHELFRTIAFNRDKARDSDGQIVMLERASWHCQPLPGAEARFIGATLWTDFRLDGTPAQSMAVAQERIEDFRVIKIERGHKLRTLLPSDTVRLHTDSTAFLRKELAQPFDGTTIVVTHHAPSRQSIAARFAGDALNPAFASDLEPLIRRYAPALWIHGHMHDSFDYRVAGTRVVCNPRGYFPDQLNPRFDPEFVVQV